MHAPSIHKPTIRSQEHLVSGEGTAEFKETREGQRATEGTTARRRTDAQKAERYWKMYNAAKGRVAELERDLEDVSRSHKHTVEKQTRHIHALENELAQTKELLAARTMELSGAQSFLSTTDRLSEAEVLGIVRDLNENIFQVAANLTEEWERFRPGRSSRFKMKEEDIDALCRSLGPTLIHHVRGRDPVAVTFSIQSCLCDFAMQISSCWQHRRGSRAMKPVYERLSASEGQAISARWRSLAHRYLSKPQPASAGITESVADILWITGSFAFRPRSSDFVKEKASNGITTIEKLALRLDSVFMQDIMSSDMYLLYEPPGSEFDDRWMTKEVESDDASTLNGKDRVAGTTEVGLEKTVSAGRRGGLRAQVLLKTTVILGEDLTELQRSRHEA